VADVSPHSTISAILFNSGFVWRIEVQGDRSFDLDLLRSLRDALREVSRLHAARMEHPPLVLSFAELADMLGRLWPGLVQLSACTLPLRPLTLPSGATGCLHLSAWPALRAALEQRGIAADGPDLGASEEKVTLNATAPRGTTYTPPTLVRLVVGWTFQSGD
jgi:hypothetical protein